MDKELQAMIDCPEIQGKAKWEVGTRTDRGIVAEVKILCSDKHYEEVHVRIDKTYIFHYAPAILYEPTIEDVVGWLGTLPYSLISPMEAMISEWTLLHHVDHSGIYSIYYADTLLKALLKLWMWVEYSKEWKEGVWK